MAGLVALAVLTLAFNLDIGFVAITIGLVLSLIAPNLQKRAMGQVTWPEIMLITGVSTYVGVLEQMGTIDFVGHSVAGLASPLMAALLLCLIGAVVSAFASSTAVLGSLIPLAVPFLQAGTGVSADRLHRRDGGGLDHRRRQPVLDQWRARARQRAGCRPRRLLPPAAGLWRPCHGRGSGRRLAGVRGSLSSSACGGLPEVGPGSKGEVTRFPPPRTRPVGLGRATPGRRRWRSKGWRRHGT